MAFQYYRNADIYAELSELLHLSDNCRPFGYRERITQLTLSLLLQESAALRGNMLQNINKTHDMVAMQTLDINLSQNVSIMLEYQVSYSYCLKDVLEGVNAAIAVAAQ